MATYSAILIPITPIVPLIVEKANLKIGVVVLSNNYAATVNPAFGQNITEQDG